MPGCSNLLLLDIQKLVILIIKQNHWKFSGFHRSLYIIYSFRFPLVHSSLNYVKMPLNAVEIIIKASAFLFLCCLWPTEMIQETTEKSVIFISVTIHQSESSQYIRIMWPICFSLGWCGQDFVCRLHLQQVETCKKKFWDFSENFEAWNSHKSKKRV